MWLRARATATCLHDASGFAEGDGDETAGATNGRKLVRTLRAPLP